MLPNLPALANWTDFRYCCNLSTNTQEEKEVNEKNCSKRPKLVDIKESF